MERHSFLMPCACSSSSLERLPRKLEKSYAVSINNVVSIGASRPLLTLAEAMLCLSRVSSVLTPIWALFSDAPLAYAAAGHTSEYMTSSTSF